MSEIVKDFLVGLIPIVVLIGIGYILVKFNLLGWAGAIVGVICIIVLITGFGHLMRKVK